MGGRVRKEVRNVEWESLFDELIEKREIRSVNWDEIEKWIKSCGRLVSYSEIYDVGGKKGGCGRKLYYSEVKRFVDGLKKKYEKDDEWVVVDGVVKEGRRWRRYVGILRREVVEKLKKKGKKEK